MAAITGRLVTEAIVLYPQTANWEWSVAIIDDPQTVNAWCMAGGRMAVYTGLFDKLKLTDDEFAQIMGHEISHALANHTAERMSRAMATSVGVLAVGIASDKPMATMAGGAMAAKLALELPNSRTEAAVSLWQKMGALGGSAPPQFLSTHPAPGNREAALEKMIPEMRKLNPTGKLAPVTAIEIVREVTPS